jgi:hypothetical protein
MQGNRETNSGMKLCACSFLQGRAKQIGLDSPELNQIYSFLELRAQSQDDKISPSGMTDRKGSVEASLWFGVKKASNPLTNID